MAGGISNEGAVVVSLQACETLWHPLLGYYDNAVRRVRLGEREACRKPAAVLRLARKETTTRRVSR